MQLAWGRAADARVAQLASHTAFAALVVGIAFGAILTRLPGTEALTFLTVLSLLGAAIFALARVGTRSHKTVLTDEAAYRAFFEHAIEGIFRTTPDGHYLDANPALARIYGYESAPALMAELTNIADQLYVDPSRRAAFQALMLANDQVSHFQSEIVRRDGAKIWISENARAVRDWTGQIICYEGTVEDVTQRHTAERELRAALRQTEEANRAKSAFLAAMSHELKTPLNAVLGFSEIIKDEMLGPITPAPYRGYAADIHTSGTRLLAIISDILDVARLSGGAITLNTRPCMAASLAEEAATMARLATKDVRSVAIDAPDSLPQVEADPQWLRQALANLLSNALKFTPEGGEITLTVTASVTGAMSFAVHDTGIGMDNDKISAALEPFRQLDRSLARRFEGAGLGLSIAKSLIELHGGELLIESAAGAGTTATLVLPPARTITRKALAGGALGR
ncbi:MAG: PAS domain S-box protein [Alphaproteobacteria bacterium]|nr:PAS domain S-box protein [Alphaproteobacteria bacterium]MBV9420427.1 PAS domain S-box protein [Alphaproteobacteria bacterium]MBV9539953.1 PAS domain S-box protein [Alphaproteobacteria bacterium]